MKKGLLIAFTVLGSMAFINCSSDDNGGGSDCVDCTQMGVKMKYCYNKGDNFYTMSVMGQDQKVPLGDFTWDETKATLKEACGK